MSLPAPEARPACRACQHYYITWDRRYPYGCKQLGFKAAIEPATVVWQSSGRRCLAFRPRPVKET